MGFNPFRIESSYDPECLIDVVEPTMRGAVSQVNIAYGGMNFQIWMDRNGNTNVSDPLVFDYCKPFMKDINRELIAQFRKWKWNTEGINNLPLSSVENFNGYYELEDGRLMEAHEWLDPDWEEEEDDDWEYDDDWEDEDGGYYEEKKSKSLPDGSIYYDIYDSNGECEDGGVLGYKKGDRISYFNDWLHGANHGCKVKRVIAFQGSQDYSDIESVLDEGVEAYQKIKPRFGLKNRKVRGGWR